MSRRGQWRDGHQVVREAASIAFGCVEYTRHTDGSNDGKLARGIGESDTLSVMTMLGTRR
jgi:hypothetical protein